MNSQITALLELGADAADNLFDVYITPPAGFNDAVGLKSGNADQLTKALRIRVQGFDPPVFKTKVYAVKYKSVGVNRPAPVIEGDRSFKLNFRLDAYYDVYVALTRWRNLIFTPSTGFASNSLIHKSTSASDQNKPQLYLGAIDVFALRVPVQQQSDNTWQDLQGIATGDILSATGNAGIASTIHWRFQNVWISDLEEPKFKQGGGDSQMIAATFQFGEFADVTNPASLPGAIPQTSDSPLNFQSPYILGSDN